ncbi:hypothetical protein NC653_039718 [Populus alba x Populus x berolinensis]|uniref:Uncharacterized protein n=1 Tax=Populus alba x Populus x berolinensis TaxID=444605 RepID=A0AAD6LCJ5_9ROSI|nr:hypothetical protein NC653_039718 [Populus alba x Populus x berolinensis]
MCYTRDKPKVPSEKKKKKANPIIFLKGAYINRLTVHPTRQVPSKGCINRESRSIIHDRTATHLTLYSAADSYQTASDQPSRTQYKTIPYPTNQPSSNSHPLLVAGEYFRIF